MRKGVLGVIAAALIAGSIGFFVGVSSTYVTGKVVNNYKVGDRWYSVVEVQGQQVVIDKYKEINSEVKFYSF